MTELIDAAAPAAGQVTDSQTAEIVCAQRAAETRRPAAVRMIDDPYARHFITKAAYRSLVATRRGSALTRTVFDRLYPGFMGIVLLRNRRWESLLDQARRDGIDQIVLLGAGYDTTSLRLNLDGVRLFEVDAPPTQQVKQAVIAKHALTGAPVSYVPCDFERDSLPGRLVDAGFDASRPCLIGWWGVTFFLTADAVRRTLTDLAGLSAPGSRLAFDYLDVAVVEGSSPFPGARRARAAVEKRGEGYRFGLSRSGAEQFVAEFGYSVRANESITDLAVAFPAFPYSTDDFFGVITAERS